jgi:uncharacterized protein DUF6048
MMPKQSICKYLFILTFSALVFGSAALFAQTDTTATDTTSSKKVKKKETAGHELNLGFDFFHPIVNSFLTVQSGYEIAADYYMKNEYYLVAEGGWGGSNVNYPDLKYTTTNNFLRLGFNRSVLTRDRPKDWDMMFIGLRAAYAGIDRSPSTYQVLDSLWGNSSGSGTSQKFHAVWAEVTGGVRVDLIKALSIGWNIRGKFLMNGRSFKSYAPLYIAGYGRGDKNSVFDFNMYISYAIRWKRKSLEIGKLKN